MHLFIRNSYMYMWQGVWPTPWTQSLVNNCSKKKTFNMYSTSIVEHLETLLPRKGRCGFRNRYSASEIPVRSRKKHQQDIYNVHIDFKKVSNRVIYAKLLVTVRKWNVVWTIQRSVTSFGNRHIGDLFITRFRVRHVSISFSLQYLPGTNYVWGIKRLPEYISIQVAFV